MANEADYLKAARTAGFREDSMKYKLREIKEIEKEGHYISWQWYIDKLSKEAFQAGRIYHN